MATKRKIADGIFCLPDGWKEINPRQAKTGHEVVVCRDCTGNTAVYYSPVPACELSEESANRIRELARQNGLTDDISIFGIVNIQGFAHDVGGAEIIHKKNYRKEIEEND